MNPFDILGITHNSSWTQVREAYKKMCVATHPDRHGGNAKFFMMVHEAYQDLEKQYDQRKTERKAPTTKQHYNPKDESVPDPKRVPENKFNEHFDRNAIFENNPYRSNGYGKQMSQSLQHQEDHSELMRQQVHVPRKREVIIYKEPEAIHSNIGWMQNYAEFGVENVKDFSCSSGTDYQRAYSTPEECVDTRQKYHKLEALQHERENTNMRMTREEQEYQQKREENNARMEQYRRQAFKSHNRDVVDRYVQLNRRLV